MLFKTWLAEWFTNYVMPSAKDKTYTRYADNANHNLIPKLGDYLINGTTESIVVLVAISLYISEQNNTMFVWTNSQ